MSENQESGKEVLDRTLRRVASGGENVNGTERMRAALALAALDNSLDVDMRKMLWVAINPTRRQRPNALTDYLSRLEVSQGRLAGQSFEVLRWQRRFIRGAFRDGVQSAALSVARGNGKTALLSGIACATLDGPLAVSRGETVIVASSFEQARIAFEHVVAFMGDKLADKRAWKVWDTAQQARIEHRETGARVRCIGSDPRRAHGLAPVLVLADEPAQWPENTGERMVAALRTAAGKQPFSRFVALGTRPADAEHWFSKMLAGGADYCPMPRREAGRSPLPEADLGKGQPLIESHAGPFGSDPDRGEASEGGPGAVGRLRGFEAESRNAGY